MHGTIISNVSEIRGVDKRMMFTLLLLILEDSERPGTVIFREALEVVGAGAEVCVGADARVEMEKKKWRKEK